MKELRQIRDALKRVPLIKGRRDDLIRQALRESKSQRAIAEAAGVSPATVGIKGKEEAN